jgi:hypothetical protein
MRFALGALTLAAAIAFGQDAAAQEDDPEAPSLPQDAPDEAEPEVTEEPQPRTQEERLIELEDKIVDLEQRLRSVEEQEKSPITVAGYVDFGFFAPIGDGPGWVQDFGNERVPELAGQYGWVFLGDILSTTVNTRGEAADLGDAPGATRFDSIHSRGAPGFLLNEVNLRVNVGLHETVKLTTSVNFVPRTGAEFGLGDFFDLDVAEVEWRVLDAPDISLFAGKIDPVIGIEYKERKADSRFGITPSLIGRYTTGTQLGVKARGKFFDDWLIVALAFTNGTSTVEQFHFYDEVDSNAGKNVSGRLAVRIPLGSMTSDLEGHTLELGGSGEFGPQDRNRGGDGFIWFAGADLEYRAVTFAIKAEFLKGKAPGSDVFPSWELDLKTGAYLEIDWMILPWLGVMVRGGLRDAFVALGSERAYITQSWRVTGGVRVVLNHHIIFKAEYLKNGEYGDVPEFQNDIFTSSLLLRY